MNRYQLFAIIGLVTLIAIPIVLNLVFGQDNQNGSDQPDDPNTEQPDNQNNGNGQDNGNNQGDENGQDTNGNQIIWGVDSASYTDQTMYQCVVDNFGEPSVWGRYLGDIEGVSQGIDQQEAEFLHERDVRILVIYNLIEDATGYDNGVQHAEQAISMAEDLNIPEGVALFGDIEPSFPVDSEFIQGWYDALASSNYESGLYGVYDPDSDVLTAYNATNQEAQENTIVWTAYPQEGITTKENAPEYNPSGPESSMLYGWQYGLSADTCNIDTNLFNDDVLNYLW